MDGSNVDDASRWWLALPGQQPIGPLAADEVRASVRSAGASGEWQICRVGESQWRPLASEPAFAELGAPAPPPLPATTPPAGAAPVAGENRGLLVCIHLGVFAGYLVPVAGLVLPLVLWLVNREKPGVEAHGKEVMNWIVFTLLATVACLPLVFLCGIGVVLAIVVGVAVVVCAIVGAVKASNGELFRYPMPFRLIQ